MASAGGWLGKGQRHHIIGVWREYMVALRRHHESICPLVCAVGRTSAAWRAHICSAVEPPHHHLVVIEAPAW